MIFATLFFSTILDHFEDPSDVTQLFLWGISQKATKKDPVGDDEDVVQSMDDVDSLRASITIFFVRVLKSSPKYKKGSRFRTNHKAAIKACDTDGMTDMV